MGICIPLLQGIVTVMFVLLLSSPILAATFSVLTVAELENALAIAGSNDADDTISIGAGTYHLTESLIYDSHEDKSIVLVSAGGEVILDGGGLNERVLFMRTYTQNGDITIKGITITNGYAQEGANGAGLFVNIARGTLVLEETRIVDCFAGAFYFSNHGGGAYITAGLGADVEIRNCIIGGNSAKGLGGGMYLSLIDGSLTFVNNTVVNNTNRSGVVEQGGGIYLRLFFDTATARLDNNILWGNSYAHGNGDLYIENDGDSNGTDSSAILSNNDYRQLDYHLDTSLLLAENISQDPLLGTDFRLKAGSPCLDSGNQFAPGLPTHDFEGDRRIVQGECGIDIGADEYLRPPVVTTSPVSGITSTTANSGGAVLYEGGHSVARRGVCWSTAADPTLADSCTVDGSGLGTFGSSLAGLTEQAPYFVRAYATSCEGTTYGVQTQFLPTSKATVITSSISYCNGASTIGGGSVTGSGDSPVTARGVCWSTAPQPTLEGNSNCTADGKGTGKFVSTFNGLRDGTTYYYRAYAINSDGTSFGGEHSFKAFKNNPWPLFLPAVISSKE